MALTEEQLRSKIISDAAATAQRAQSASASLTNPSGFSASIPTASPFPISGLSSLQPQGRSSIPIAGGGTASFGLGGATINFPYSYGTITRTPQQFASGLPQAPVAPSNLFSAAPVADSLRPTSGGMLDQQYTNPFASPTQRMGENLSLGLTPVTQPTSMSIGGGPMSLTSGSAMTNPQTAEQRGLTAIPTPRGTIYVTGAQQRALGARTTSFEGRTPAEQQALLAQVRERGRAMAGAQETFFAQKAEERKGLRAAEQMARAAGASPFDIMRAREATQPSSNLAAIRGQAYGYTQMMPSQGLANAAASSFLNKLGSRPSNVSELGLSGYDLYNYQQATKLASGMYNTSQGLPTSSSFGTPYSFNNKLLSMFPSGSFNLQAGRKTPPSLDSAISDLESKINEMEKDPNKMASLELLRLKKVLNDAKAKQIQEAKDAAIIASGGSVMKNLISLD